MATLAVQDAMDVPGRLGFKDSGDTIDFTSDWPHGGTELGFIDKVFVDYRHEPYEVTAEEYGGEVVDVVATHERWMLRGVLRSDDPDAWALLALNSSAGTVTQFRTVETTGSNRAGYFYTSRETVVFFTPESVIDGNDDQHPMVVFYNALPHIRGAQSIALHAREPNQWAVSFLGIRDASDRTVKINYRADIANP